MNSGNKIWLSVWLLMALLLGLEVYFLLSLDNPLMWGTRFLCTLIATVGLVEIRLLRSAGPIFQKLGWVLGSVLLLLLLAQCILPYTVLILWNFTLACLALLSGLLMYAMVGNSTMGRAFVVFLTLCICLLMILEFAAPLVHKIALGVFVTGALICIHVMTTARSH